LRKNISAVLSLSFALAISTSLAYAQQAAPEPKVSADQAADNTVQLMRQDIRSERKKIAAANLPLTEAEAVKFWPGV
jgi:anti-sigma-K factor RskA